MDSKKGMLPTAEEIAAKREAALGLLSATSAKGQTHVSPMSAEQMDNFGTWVTVGTLRFMVKAPTIRRAAELSDVIENHFPALLVYAALGDEDGNGIDPAATAVFWSDVNAEDPETVAKHPQGVPPVTREMVEYQVRALSRRIVQEVKLTGNDRPRVVGVIADALWLVACETPGWTRESLPDLIQDNLSVPQLADLLRVLNRCVGGFPGDQAERFALP